MIGRAFASPNDATFCLTLDTSSVQLVVNIVVLASIYALIACGYVLIYRVSRVLNLAHGELMMLGAYMVLATASLFNGHPVIALAAAILLSLAGRRAGLCLSHAQDDRRDGACRDSHDGRARHSRSAAWWC